MYSKSIDANYVYTMMWMLHVVLLVLAHVLLEYRYMDDVMENLFFFVLFNIHGFDNVCEIISG